MAMMKKAVPAKKPATKTAAINTYNKTIGENGPKGKYFEAKFALEKDPKNPTLQRKLTDRQRTLARAHDIYLRQLREAKASAAVIKKAAANTPTAMGQSAKSHQASLAKISGTTAAIKAGKPLPKAGRNEAVGARNAKVTIAAYDKATKKTAASFKKSK